MMIMFTTFGKVKIGPFAKSVLDENHVKLKSFRLPHHFNFKSNRKKTLHTFKGVEVPIRTCVLEKMLKNENNGDDDGDDDDYGGGFFLRQSW